MRAIITCHDESCAEEMVSELELHGIPYTRKDNVFGVTVCDVMTNKDLVVMDIDCNVTPKICLAFGWEIVNSVWYKQ